LKEEKLTKNTNKKVNYLESKNKKAKLDDTKSYLIINDMILKNTN